MTHPMESRSAAAGREERGMALVAALFFVVILAGAALTLAVVANANSTRSANERLLDEAASVGESAFSYIVEQWRALPDTNTGTAFLYPKVVESSGFAEVVPSKALNADATYLGTWYQIGAGQVTSAAGTARAQGRFCITKLQNSTIGQGSGKVIQVLCQYGDLNYTWEAVLVQNTSSPIQGVGTSNGVTWGGGSFTGGSNGAVFSNGNISVASGSNIGGSVYAAGTVSNSGSVSGSVSPGQPPVTFPDQAAIVSNALTAAQAVPNTSFWNNQSPTAAITAALAAQPANQRPMIQLMMTAPPSGWSNLGTGATARQAHMIVKGNNTTSNVGSPMQYLTLPGSLVVGGVTTPQQYAFGRLWIDGATVTIQAPPNGGVLVLPDLFVTNGGRLIIDTSASTPPAGSPPLQILNQGGNQWEPPIANGASATYPLQTYNPSLNTWPTTTFTTTGSGNSKAVTGGYSPGAPQGTPTSGGTGNWTTYGDTAKPPAGNGGYDEWQIANSAFLATVTSAPLAQGAIFYNTAGTDFVMTNGGYIMGGIQSTNSSTLSGGSFSAASGLFATSTNPTGWIGWSGGVGSNNARFNINANSHGAGNGIASGYSGLTYGSYSGAIGNGGSLNGAFVGYNMSTTSGATIKYDQSLQSLVQSSAPNTNHVMTRRRIADPSAAVLTKLGAN